jgi:hypothetical protein
MPLRLQLWSEVQAALAGVPSANLTRASAGEDLYESYVWSLVLEAASNEGATIRLRDRYGNLPTQFWFRTSPSNIFSIAHSYCHAEIEFPTRPVLEAHIGIFVAGRSKVPHECDVAVLYKNEAEICRSSSVHPRSGKVILTAECKYYINSTIGINLGRSFLGLLNDIYTGDRYFYTGDRYFVATSDSASVSMLFSKHNKEYELGLSPLDPHLEARLRGSFEKTFRDFRSSRS